MAVTHSPADRQFYSIEPDAVSKSHFNTPTTAEKEKLLDYVASSIIGKDKTFCGPFGERRAVYLDYIASGRALSFIEDYIQKEVLPEYGNTHTTTSVTSLQTTLFRHEARDIIRNAVNASEHDSVIFTGSGSTGTIHKLIHALNLKEPPVVFVGPFEHHSNLLPWREVASEVVSIRQTKDGVVDVCHLEQQLQAFANSGCQLIGSFNAASNVTGILCDVDSITILLHKYGALALWDYATAGPYVRLDMNPVLTGEDSCLVYKDAMFISPHKFMGGVCTPGVLIAKKNLFHSNVPKECGGGTVFFVRREAHRYLHEPELREEGGTPNIVGSIRTGLVFQLKMAITPELIMEKERSLCRRAIEAWRSVPNLVILGNLQAERLPVFSFLVHHPASGRFLHYNYVSVLLNDLFGIQARGGCACAGPYSMELLGLAEETAAEIEKLLAEDSRLDRVHLRRYTEYSPREIIRPGFTRLNLPYFISEEQLDFVLQAVAMVTEHGWKLLPQYMFNPDTGEWRHKEHQVFKERKWLGHVSYASGHMQYSVPRVSPKAPLPQSFQECLNVAKQLFIKAEKSRFKLADQSLMFDEEARPYRWFLLPSEANQILCGSTPMVPCTPSGLPFCPPELRERWTTGQEMQDVEWTVVNGQTASARSDSALTASTDGGDVWVRAEDGLEEQKSEMVIGEKKASCPKEGSSDLHTTSSARLCQDVHSAAEKNSSDNSIQESGDSSPSQVTQSSRPHHPQQSESSHESAASSVDLGADGSASCDGFSHVVQTAMERGYWDNVSSCSGPASISLHGDYEVTTVLPQTNPEPVFGPAAAVHEDSAWAPGRGHGDASAERTESTRESLSSRQSPPVLADSDGTCRGEPPTPRTTPSAADATTVTGIFTLEGTRSPKEGADRELHVEEGTSNPGPQQAGSGEHGTESTSNQGMQQARSGDSNPGTQQARSGEHGTESTSNPGTQQAGSGEHGTESTSNPGTQQARSGEHGTESTSNQGMQQARSGDSNPGVQQARSGDSNPGTQQARSGEHGTESTSNQGMQQARSGDSNPGTQQARSGEHGTESTSNPGMQQARSGDSNQGMQQARSARKGRESTSNPGAQLAMSSRNGRESTSNPGVQLARSPRKGRESTSNPGAQLARSPRKGRESTSNPGAQQARSGRKGRESTSNPGVQQARSPRKGRESTSNPGVLQARSGRKGRECGRRWVPPPKEIFKLSVKAMQEYSMIRDGDRVLLCLSGGKDSLSLLHVLHQYQFYCRSQGIDFDLGAVTVDPQTPSYDPSPLKLYLAALGVPYFYESQCIMETAVNLPYECASICSFCSRMKRGRIYAAARREGYNVLALGQHLDDLAESFIMSLFHNGSLRTMKAHYTVQEGDLRVVRPFVYVREKDLRNFAEKSKLPVITENCPACFESPKERHRTKQLLASQEILFPRLYGSILSAIKPVMALSRTGVSAASCIAAAHPADDLDID